MANDKKTEINHWTSFSVHGSGPGPSLGFWGQNFMMSSNFGSVRSDRAGPRVSGPGWFDQNDPLTRDSGELRQIWPQIRNLRKMLGHIGLVWVVIWHWLTSDFFVTVIIYLRYNHRSNVSWIQLAQRLIIVGVCCSSLRKPIFFDMWKKRCTMRSKWTEPA